MVELKLSYKLIQLTALVGTPIFGHTLVQGLLLPEVVLISFAVSAWTCTNPTFKRPSAQYLTTAKIIQKRKKTDQLWHVVL